MRACIPSLVPGFQSIEGANGARPLYCAEAIRIVRFPRGATVAAVGRLCRDIDLLPGTGIVGCRSAIGLPAFRGSDFFHLSVVFHFLFRAADPKRDNDSLE